MPAERRAVLERVVWEAIGSGGGEGEEGGEEGDGNDGDGGGREKKALPALPPKEILAAKLVAASSASGLLVRRDAQRLCRALGVRLKTEGGEEEEEEEEEEEIGGGEVSGDGDGSKPSERRRRPRAAAPPLLSSLPGRRTGGGHRAHGLAVVRALASAGRGNDESESGAGIGTDGPTAEPALDALAARFRRAFVAAVAPRFLPTGWAVDAPLGRKAHGPYSAVVRAEEEARERSAAEARERRRRARETTALEEVEEVAASAF
jgi:hypothetical protein